MTAGSAAAGLRVLVTRPRERARGLLERIAGAGAEPVAFPTIAIEPIAGRRPPAAGCCAAVVFVSPAAVTHGADLLEAVDAGAVAAIGAATAAALRRRGVTVDAEPIGSRDSEGLLRHPALAAARVRGRRVLVVRGSGGRAHLGDALMARGAAVDYAEVYRRTRPTGTDPEQAAASDIVTVTSNEGLANLVAMIDSPRRGRLLARPLVVASARAADYARTLGFTGPVEIAGGADDDALMAAVERCAASLRPDAPGPR